MKEHLTWHINGQQCPSDYFSSSFCFLSLTLRKMSIIFRLQSVCTYLVPINMQQYGAEQENNGASNLCLVLHKVCLLVHSVFLWLENEKALNLNCLTVAYCICLSCCWGNIIKMLTVCWAWSHWTHEILFPWSRFEPGSCRGHNVIHLQGQRTEHPIT